MFTTLLLALASAQDMTLQVEGNPSPGAVVTVTIDGLTPGEPAYLVSSTELGSTCPRFADPYCSDLARPRVLARGTPNGTSVVVDVTVPDREALHHLQAISPSGVSPVWDLDAIVIDEVDPGAYMPPLVVGVAILCNNDSVDLIAQYMGDADDLRADAYRDGSLVVSHTLTTEPAPPGSIFFDAIAFGGTAPTCADLTWVVEASNPAITTCVVRGDEADGLRGDGSIDPACADI